VEHFVCLFFDADGIVRATDTIAAERLEDAAARARTLLKAKDALRRFELWRDGVRIARGDRDEGDGAR
jgi:hypothetical protein